MDGPLADFTQHVFDHVGPPDHPLCGWDILDGLSPRQRRCAQYLLSNPKWWRDLPVVEGAEEGVQAFQNAGHRLFFVTSPYESCPDWHSARVEWLSRNFGIHSDQVVATRSKQWVYGDVFIDDKPGMVKAWSRRHRHGHAYVYYREEVPSEGLRQFTWHPDVLRSVINLLEVP